ncbi:MAG: hypothetical protein HRU03_07470 [Nanoarchaeales archaeon]|nr:hypothetical protein [Nanoarchaeales archaeon]
MNTRKILKLQTEDITLDLIKIKKVSLIIYSFFCLFIFAGLNHFMFVSLGFLDYKLYYLYIFFFLILFFFVGRRIISFAFDY